MEINTIEEVKSIIENPVIEHLSKHKVRVGYKTKNKLAIPKSMTLPSYIKLDENFAEGLGLYIGDGKLTPNDLNHLEFSTIDEDMAEFFLNFIKNRLYITVNDISFSIRYRYGNEDKLKQKWSKLLKIPISKLVTKKRHQYKMLDNITIQVNSIIVRKLFKKIIDISLPIIQKDEILRRAFLRGEFAADGKFGKEKDTNTYYISEVTFCHDANKELWLRDYITNCLKSEGVTKFNIIPGYIRVTGWDNYIKFWNMKLFDLCQRKKDKFLDIIKQCKTHLKINRTVIAYIIEGLGLTTTEITKLLNLHRTNLTRVKEGEQLLTMEQVHILLKVSGLSWDHILKHTDKIRIGKLTSLDPDRNFIDFLIEEKNLK